MTYIRLEDLQKFPIRKDHYDKEHGNEHFIYGVETVLEYAEHLPTYDVVSKSEVACEVINDVSNILNDVYRKCDTNSVNTIIMIAREIIKLKKKYDIK